MVVFTCFEPILPSEMVVNILGDGPLPFRLPPIGLTPTGLPPNGLPPFGLRLKSFGLRLESFGPRLKSFRLPPFGLIHTD